MAAEPDRRDFPGGSRRSRALATAGRRLVRPWVDLWGRHPDLPWPYPAVDWAGRVLRTPGGLTRTPVGLPHCAATLTSPAAPTPDELVLYLHGGAFLIGGRHLHRQLTSRIAVELNTPVLAVGYRKLPAHSVDESIADCLDGYRAALERASRITIMGDSAGGYLTFMTALGARDQGLPPPAAIVALAPLISWDLEPMLAAPTAATCAVLTPALLRSMLATARTADGGRTPRSPADLDLTGLPPTLVQVSSSELLYPDAVLIARRLAEHGVPCELQVWADQIHVFQAAASINPESAAAVAEIRAFVGRHRSGVG
jgi:acetyl esterase/lipase